MIDIKRKLTRKLNKLLPPIYSMKHKGVGYRFYCPNNLTEWRFNTYFTKEPETIEWIDTFKKGEVLYDIGSNIGLYAIYAAKKNIYVHAFEPESQNFAILNKNIFLNNCQDKAMAWCIGFSDKTQFNYLYMANFQDGGAMNSLVESGKERPVYKQAAMSFALDDFLFDNPICPPPDHIKIDVDGLELEIINGAKKTLGRLRSILVEIEEDSPKSPGIIETLQQKGFKMVHKKRAEMFNNTEYSHYYNYIFKKER